MLGIEIATWSPIETALITAFFLGVEGFWAWALLIRDEPSTARANGVPEETALRSAATLRAAMVVEGGDPSGAALPRIVSDDRDRRVPGLAVPGRRRARRRHLVLFSGGRFKREIELRVTPIWIAVVVARAVLLAIRVATGLHGKGLDAAETQLCGFGLTSQSARRRSATRCNSRGPRPGSAARRNCSHPGTGGSSR